MPRTAAATRVAAIEEAANRHRATGARFASTGAVRAADASPVASLAADRCGAARLEEKGKKRERWARDANGPAWLMSLDPSCSCRGYLSPGIGCQCVGVILLGSPFSPTHSPASGDQ